METDCLNGTDRMDEFVRQQAAVAAALARPVFFVIGAPKSGTTWVQMLLDGHPEIRCAGEGHFLDWLGQPLRDLLMRYNQRLDFNNRFVYRGDGDYGGYLEADFRFLLCSLMGLAWAKLDIPPQVRIIGEKTPLNSYSMAFLAQLFPGCRFLHVIRDGRDAAASICHQKLRLGDDPAVQPGSAAWYDFVAAFGRKWVEVIGHGQAWGRAHPDSYCEVRYEALLAEPRPHLARLARFLGVCDDDQAIAAMVAHGAFERLSGGRRRGQGDAASFYRKGVSGDWRETFDDRALTGLLAIIAPDLERLGYAID